MFRLINSSGCDLGIVARSVEELCTWLMTATLEPGDRILVESP